MYAAVGPHIGLSVCYFATKYNKICEAQNLIRTALGSNKLCDDDYRECIYPIWALKQWICVCVCEREKMQVHGSRYYTIKYINEQRK